MLRVSSRLLAVAILTGCGTSGTSVAPIAGAAPVTAPAAPPPAPAPSPAPLASPSASPPVAASPSPSPLPSRSPSPLPSPSPSPSPLPSPSPSPSSSPTALLRIVGGSYQDRSVYACLDRVPLGGSLQSATIAYGGVAPLQVVTGEATHAIAIYPALAQSGTQECAGAPAPFNGTAPIATGSFSIAARTRFTVVLARAAGTGASATGPAGLYPFLEPTYATVPASASAVLHNVLHGTVAFAEQMSPGSSFTLLSDRSGLPAATTGGPNAVVVAPIASPPATFDLGIVDQSNTFNQIGGAQAIAPVAGRPYVADIYAIETGDSPTFAQVIESTSGYGF